MFHHIFFLFIATFLSVLPVKIANSCGGWDYYGDEAFLSPFNQAVFDQKHELEIFLYTDHILKGIGNIPDEESGPVVSSNIDDWEKHFNGRYSRAELNAVIFETSTDAFQEIKNYIQGGADDPQDSLLHTKLVKDLRKGKYKNEKEYLFLAKETEPYAVSVSNWYWDYDRPVIDSLRIPKMESLMQRSEAGALKAKDKFLKQRYVYQALRMAHYSDNFDSCTSIYERYRDDLIENSEMSYLCLSLYAGALLNTGREPEAAYANAKVFDKSETRKATAVNDFYIGDIDEWKKCISYCKNDHEKEVVWMMTGYKNPAAYKEIIHTLLDINSSSKGAELLICRQLEMLQRMQLPDRYNNPFADYYDYFDDDYSSSATGYELFETDSVINAVLARKDLGDPSFWYSAFAFIKYMQNDFPNSKIMADKALATAGNNDDFRLQAIIFQTLNYVRLLNQVTPENEKTIADYFIQLEPELRNGKLQNSDLASNIADAKTIIFTELADLYTNQNDLFNAEVCKLESGYNYEIYDIKDDDINLQLYHFKNESGGDDWTRQLRKYLSYSDNQFLELLGTRSLVKDDIPQALNYYSQLTDTVHDYNLKLYADPFMIHIWDCHDCDYAAEHTEYTKISLCRKIQELKNDLASGSGDKAMIYHQLGNAYYNMSYYGNSWKAKGYYYGWDTDPSCEQALDYYSKAMENSIDREFVAFNLFLKAKCEQNAYYESDDFDYDDSDEQKHNWQSSFAELSDQYSDTELYKEAIGECKFFEYYVGKYK